MPTSMAFDSKDNLYIISAIGCAIRRIDRVTGWIDTYAGDLSACGMDVDGSPVTRLHWMLRTIATSPTDDIIFQGRGIRRIDAATGVLTTVVGPVDPPGIGPLATSTVGVPNALVAVGKAPAGPQWLITDSETGRVRSLRLDTEWVGAVVGYPEQDSSIARYTRLLQHPFGIAADAAGTVYVTERDGHVVRSIDTTVDPWMISDFGGTSNLPGFADGDVASALFDSPAGLAFDDATRTLYLADSRNHVVRAIDVDSGSVTTYAGTPRYRGMFGDGVDATMALLHGPEALAMGLDGSLYIADTQNHRVRRVDSAGMISTVVGDGTPASIGVGAPAAVLSVDTPRGLAVDPFGNLFVTSRNTIRVVDAGTDGIATGADAVTTIYGTFPRETYPESVTSGLTGLAFDPATDGKVLYVLDTFQGLIVRLSRQP